MELGLLRASLATLRQHGSTMLRLHAFWIGVELVYGYSTLPRITMEMAGNWSLLGDGVHSVAAYLVSLLIAFGLLAANVGWHRHVLLGEIPPRFHILNLAWPTLPYIIQSIKIAIPLFAIAIVANYLLLLVGILVVPSTDSITFRLHLLYLDLLHAVAGFPVNMFCIWLVFRFGLILPAAAIGSMLTLGQSFSFTRFVNRELITIAATITLMETLLSVGIALVMYFRQDGSFGLFLALDLLAWSVAFFALAAVTQTYVTLINPQLSSSPEQDEE